MAAMWAVLAAPASAHWNPGDPYKWVQNPDLAQTGIDVRATATAILADDFQCEVAGPLTDIHVWGSWYHDVLPDDNPGKVTFILAIHKDIPAGTGGIPYSRPGAVLWYRSYPPGSFTWNLYQGGLQEGWLNPPSDYDSFADTKCYQYNFTVPAGAIRQTGTEAEPKVYWLAVQAVPEVPPAIFGWKT